MTSAQVPGSAAHGPAPSEATAADSGSGQWRVLRQMLEQKRAQGVRLPLNEAVELLVPLCVELAEIHRQGYGVYVHPSNLVLNPRGGLSLSTELAAQAPTLPSDMACLPPEAEPGELGPATASVYAIGAILYEMLTGLRAGRGMRRPREVVPSLPQPAEVLMSKALVSDPARRPADLNALAQALYTLAPQETIPPPPQADLSHLDQVGDFEVDVSLSMLPPASLEEAVVPPGGGLPSNGFPPNSVPRLEQGRGAGQGPASLNHPQGRGPNSAVGLAPAGPGSGPRSHPGPISSAGRPHASRADAATAELAALKARLESQTAPIYVVVKDGMDHGPFTAVELLQQIASHSFTHDDVLRDANTKEERSIGNWPDFAPFAEHARLHRDIAAEKAAIDHGVAQESKRTRGKAFIGLLLLAVALLGAGVWFVTQVGTRNDEVAIVTETVSNIEAEGDLKVKGGGAGAKGGRRVVGSQGGIPQLAGGMSCEAAQAAYVEEMKMAGGGQADITRGQYSSIMNSGAYFSHCGVPSNVAVNICVAVQGGRAVGVTVTTTPNHGSRACITSAVRNLRFPSHPKLDVVRSTFAAE